MQHDVDAPADIMVPSLHSMLQEGAGGRVPEMNFDGEVRRAPFNRHRPSRVACRAPRSACTATARHALCNNVAPPPAPPRPQCKPSSPVLLLPPSASMAFMPTAQASIFPVDVYQFCAKEEPASPEPPSSPAPRPLVVPKHVDMQPQREPPPANLTRAERVARYLEKKKRRKFEKTIRCVALPAGELSQGPGSPQHRPPCTHPHPPRRQRRAAPAAALDPTPTPTPTPPPPPLFSPRRRYASRKAYAEVRPRIKGRFAKKEELDAFRVAERAIKGRRQALRDDDELWAPEDCGGHGVVPRYRG
jgi:hypothetical protein